jgi:hypothetical protein
MEKIETIRRLRGLRPGQTMVAYRGKLEADITGSKRAPKYQALLRKVHETALQLERTGRLTLTVENEACGTPRLRATALGASVAASS